jgi:hypothetical protein
MIGRCAALSRAVLSRYAELPEAQRIELASHVWAIDHFSTNWNVVVWVEEIASFTNAIEMTKESDH